MLVLLRDRGAAGIRATSVSASLLAEIIITQRFEAHTRRPRPAEVDQGHKGRFNRHLTKFSNFY